jgi:hypothetical protein
VASSDSVPVGADAIAGACFFRESVVELDPDAGLFGFRRISESLGSSHWYLKTLRDLVGTFFRAYLPGSLVLETVWQMVSRTDEETMRFLNDVILLCTPANPDGMDLVALAAGYLDGAENVIDLQNLVGSGQIESFADGFFFLQTHA